MLRGDPVAVYTSRESSATMPKPSRKKPSVRTAGRKRKPLDIEPVNHFVGYQIRKAQLVVYDDFMTGQRTSPPITPGQFTVLLLIDEKPDISQQLLCEHMAVDKSTMAVSLHRMARRGLIQRVRSTADRRQNGLRLTASGAAVLRDMVKYVQQHERRITARLSARECKQLVALLSKVG
jgi:MarR family transcriptional regulator, temperature-dependent positive regulator of motility